MKRRHFRRDAHSKRPATDRSIAFASTAMFAAFRVASPFPTALRQQAPGSKPSEIGASTRVAGRPAQTIRGRSISRLADRFGKHRQILAVFLAMAAVHRVRLFSSCRVCDRYYIGVAHFGMAADPIADAGRLSLRRSGNSSLLRVVGAAGGASAALCRGRGERWSDRPGDVDLGGMVWMNRDALARSPPWRHGYPKCAGSAASARRAQCPRFACRSLASASCGAGGHWIAEAATHLMARCCAGRTGSDRARQG